MNKILFFRSIAIFLFLSVASQAQEFKFNGAADVNFYYPPRGAGGRALVHDENNTLTLNYGGDFSGGTRIGNSFNISNAGNLLFNSWQPAGSAYGDFFLDVEPGTRTLRTRNWNVENPNIGATGIHTGYAFFDGNVGIGTLTPEAKLNVVSSPQDANGGALIIGQTNSVNLRMGVNTDYSWIQSHGGLPLKINELGNNILLNLAGGNVGIGVTNPAARLDVAGSFILRSDLSNTSARPPLSAQKIGGEIRAYSNSGYGADDGLLRLSAGAGSTPSIMSYIDISSYSTVPDMDQNIVLGTAGAERLRINSKGNVGIGTATIDNAQGWHKVLQVHGNDHAKLLVTDAGGVKVGMFAHVGKSAKIGTESQHDLTFTAGYWNDVMTLKTNGNIGIGTTSPDEKLTVNGKIHATEIKVDLNVPAPDYVFEDDYQLPKLRDIQNYIAKNKHLPEVPSAKEMEKNGINLSDMNMLLLKKVEELTLHLIEKDVQIKYLLKRDQKLEFLNEKLKQLEDKIKKNEAH